MLPQSRCPPPWPPGGSTHPSRDLESRVLLNYIPQGGRLRPPLCRLTMSTFKKMQMEYDLGVVVRDSDSSLREAKVRILGYTDLISTLFLQSLVHSFQIGLHHPKRSNRMSMGTTCSPASWQGLKNAPSPLKPLSSPGPSCPTSFSVLFCTKQSPLSSSRHMA